MTDSDFQVPVLFDYVATFTWAVSGAIVAIRRRFDITGVFIVSLLAAVGGGLLRDTMFLNRTPVFLVDPAYLSLIAGATIITAVFARYLRNLIGPETIQKIVDYIDALGTPAFAVFGMHLAEEAGLPLMSIVFVGVANGVAGGFCVVVVRDACAAQARPVCVMTLLAACGVYLPLTIRPTWPQSCGWITVSAFFVARVLTIRFNWQTSSVWKDNDP
jgi:uncharacterized membrane protein YeiH